MTWTRGLLMKAERAGFEPAVPCGTRAFQARALGQLRYLSGYNRGGWVALLYHNVNRRKSAFSEFAEGIKGLQASIPPWALSGQTG
jgi:hypothetical protein